MDSWGGSGSIVGECVRDDFPQRAFAVFTAAVNDTVALNQARYRDFIILCSGYLSRKF